MKLDPDRSSKLETRGSKRYRIRIDLLFDSIDDVEARKAFEYVDEMFQGDVELEASLHVHTDKTVSLHEVYPDKTPRLVRIDR